MKKIILILSLIVLKSARGAEEVTASSKRFITLTADCSHWNPKNGSITLNLHTSEPFYGSLYSRDFPSSCKGVGEGATSTKLVVNHDQECGVMAVLQKRKSSRKLVSNSRRRSDQDPDLQEMHQISLYVQHDEHVQQVIDEQFLVQCWKGMAQGLVSYQDGFTNFVDSKTLSKSMTTTTNQLENPDTKLSKRILEMSPMEPMIVAQTSAPPISRRVSQDFITVSAPENSNLVDIGTMPTTPKLYEELGPKAASGWMEIVEADSGETLIDSVEVGSQVSLVIRLKQMASMDTMLSTCTAHSGDDFYDLTDFRGCTSDPEILPNFKAFFNSRTGVKRLTSTFPMFKFPDLTKVIVRCTVVVCSKNCPVAKCDQDEKSFKDVRILDKFYLDTFAEVHDSDGGLKMTTKAEIDQLQRTPPLRPEEQLDTQQILSFHSKSPQQIEEVIIESAQEQISKGDIEEDLLCLSPSRLALAFGILLVILLLALLGSCTMWMRARSHWKRPNPSTIFAPRPPRPPPGTIVPAQPRPPFMVASRGAPYIRVVQ